MARFVESAELVVLDRSTGPLKRINSELRRLGATARKVQGDLDKLAMPAMKARGSSSMDAMLRRQSTEARATAKSMGTLAASFGSAAAQADRLGSAAARANSQVRRLSASARHAGHLQNTLALGGPGGGRGGSRGGHGGRNGGYSAHLYTNPAHSIGNAALSGAFGHDLTLAQALTISALGSVIVHASHVALEGAKERSTAGERLFQRGMSPGDIRWAQSEAARVSAKYTTTSIADNLETLNDIGAAVHDRGGQSQLMELLAKRQQLAVGQGQDAKQVRDSNARLVKTLEMAGALVDSHGQFNAAKTSAMMEMIQGVESIEGRNINANQIQMATKYLKENALTQSVDNLRNVLFLGAEMSGSTAGNSLTSVINGFTGRSPKEVLANLIRNGLATGNIDAKGKVSNYELKDEQLLRSDFGGWLSKMIGPILEQKGIDAKQSPVELAKFLRTITGRTTQQDILMKWFTQAMENANKSAAAENVRQDEETARGVVNRDYNAAFVAMTKQAESAFGEIGDKIKGLVIPGLTTTRSLFTDITKALSPDATDADRRGLVKAGVGTAAGGALAAWGGAKLLGLFNPLTGAATALTSSATALDASAAALMRAAGVGVVGTGAGAAGAAATAGTKTVAATVAAAAVPVTAAAVASALGAAAVGGVTYGLVRAGVIDATKKQGTAAWTKAHPGGSGRQDRPNDEWFRGKRRETEQTKKAADEVENLKKRLHDFRGSLSNDETGNIIGRIDRIISAMSAANRAAIRNFGAPARAANGQLPYGAAGAGAPVGTAGWNSTIPQHAFSAGTFEETLKQFSTAFQSTISGLHTSTAEFEAAGRAVHADISSGADDLKAKAGDLSGGWKSDLTAGGASIATQIRSALQTPVTVNVQQSAGPNIGNVGPVRQ